MIQKFAISFFFLTSLAFAIDCPQPIKNSSVTLLIEDSSIKMNETKQQALEKGQEFGVLSMALKRLGYKTKESQEKFAQIVKSNYGFDKNSDLKNWDLEDFDYSLYSIKSIDQKWMLLKVHSIGEWEYFYYFFIKKGDGYTPVVSKPIQVFSKYCDSFPEFYSYQGHDFFSLTDCGGGTGGSIFGSEVYEVKPGFIKKVLEYDLFGKYASLPDAPFDTDFVSGPITFMTKGEEININMSFTVSFRAERTEDSPSDKKYGFVLFKKTFHLNYAWDKEKQIFELNRTTDENESNVKADEGLFDLSNTGFFKLYYPELLTLAQNGRFDQKNWLQDFLKSEELKPLDGSDQMNKIYKFLDGESPNVQ